MIKICDIVNEAFTNASGYTLYLSLVKNLDETNGVINLSFEKLHGTSSSFLNSSIGQLIEERGVEILKRIKPINVGAAQATILKNYISTYMVKV